MAFCAAAILLGAPYLMPIFTVEPELIRLGSIFLSIASVGYLMNGFITVLQTSISGSGDTRPPMVISILSIWVILLPAAFILPRITDWVLRYTVGHGTEPGLWRGGLYFLFPTWPMKE